MIYVGLQFFGGRGSGGGKRSGGGRAGGGGGGGATRESTQVSAIRSNKVFPAGTYEYEGETYNISYTKPNETNEIHQTVDGRVVSTGRVQVMVEGQDRGKYRAFNESGSAKVTGSAEAASKWAFGTPKDQGFKRKKK